MTRTLYRIEGMTRWSCADAVAERLSELDGVRHVDMDIVAGTALVTSDTAVPGDQVRAAITEAGYAPTAGHTEEKQHHGVPAGWFIGGLVVALLAGFGLARSLSPAAPVESTLANPSAHPHSQPAGGVSGLAISANGYTLVPLENPSLEGTGERRLSFVIRDRSGQAVTRFATVHEKPLHLILVRRDLTGFQHLHPTMAADGTWTYTASLTEPGLWRAYADFTVLDSQQALTLGYDITVAGDYRPRPLSSGATGVTFTGVPQVDVLAPLDFRVDPASTLEKYLGSWGHLVVLRQADLAYVHVHADTRLEDGSIRFLLSAPSSGAYRMFFQYQVAGQVHTAEFTLAVSGR